MKLVELMILDEENKDLGIDAISLVDEPAIEENFYFFGKQQFVYPNPGESESEFISRCIPVLVNEGKEQEQAAAVCYSYWKEEKMAFIPRDEITTMAKISFDYHETLNTPRGTELAKKLIAEGNDVYIISAAQDEADLSGLAKELGIPASKVFATGSNKAKVEKVKSLGIKKHYDNNADVIADLPEIGEKFGINTGGLAPYVDQTGETKKRKKKNYADLISEIIPKSQLFESDDQIAAAVFVAMAEAGELPIYWEIGYTYEGGGPERDFCDTNWMREFTMDQIWALDTANPGFGIGGGDFYDKFLYKGGPNCHHYWDPTSITLYYRGKSGVNIPYNESKHRVFLNEELAQFGYTQQDFITAQTPPIRMNNRGYMPKTSKAEMNRIGNYAFVNEEQRIVAGPIMIPDMKILRQDEDTKMFYQVYFTKQTIAKLSQKYMRELKIHNSNEQHDPLKPANVTMLESWIVEDPQKDKSGIYGYELPVGTWFGAFKINDDETWKKVKDGTFKGFSIEGNFQERVDKA